MLNIKAAVVSPTKTGLHFPQEIIKCRNFSNTHTHTHTHTHTYTHTHTHTHKHTHTHTHTHTHSVVQINRLLLISTFYVLSACLPALPDRFKTTIKTKFPHTRKDVALEKG